MTKALGPAFDYEDNEEGAADAAASLGPDGGPAQKAVVTYNDDSDPFSDDDDAWLDEDLSDEELAALAEEDFDTDELSDEELQLLADDTEEFDPFGGDEFVVDEEATAPVAEQTPETSEQQPVAEDDLGLADDFLNEEGAGAPMEFQDDDEAFLEEIADDELAPVADATPVVAATVTANALAEDEEYDSDLIEIGDDDVDHRPSRAFLFTHFVKRRRPQRFWERPLSTGVCRKRI